MHLERPTAQVSQDGWGVEAAVEEARAEQTGVRGWSPDCTSGKRISPTSVKPQRE